MKRTRKDNVGFVLLTAMISSDKADVTSKYKCIQWKTKIPYVFHEVVGGEVVRNDSEYFMGFGSTKVESIMDAYDSAYSNLDLHHRVVARELEDTNTLLELGRKKFA